MPENAEERLRKELAKRLEFYQELGIEDFYLRRSDAASLSPAVTTSEVGQVVEAMAPSETIIAPARPTGPSSLQSSPPAPRLVVAPRSPPVRSMSLFEPSTPPPVVRAQETLEQIREDLGDCHRCRLATGRHTIVFGQGDPHAKLVFVGEGPGADEDAQGLPFVGRAGQLLNRMIQFIGMKREEVYICNVVKCRPPGNRTPLPDEIEACSPFLYRQIEAIKPRLVCCLGAPAVRTVLGIKEGITKIRGQFYDLKGTKALATVHPAYILRNPREEKILREDFEKIRDFLKASS